MTATAQKGIIRYTDPEHMTDSDRVAAIVEAMEKGQEMPPILVVEDQGNGARVLDGHHRAAAARQLGVDVAAWIVSADEFWAMINEDFGGDMPNRLCDLDDHIIVDGLPYEGRGN